MNYRHNDNSLFVRQVSLLSTAGRAKAIILLIAVIGFGLSSFPLWTVGVQVKKGKIGSRNSSANALPKRCVILQDEAIKEAYKQWSTGVLRIGTLALPGIIISVVTTIIIGALLAAARRRSKHMEGQVEFLSDLLT